MFRTWKSPFRSSVHSVDLAGAQGEAEASADGGKQGAQANQPPQADPEVMRLKSAIADLRGGNTQDAQYESKPVTQRPARPAEPAKTAPQDGAATKPDTAAKANGAPAGEADAKADAAQKALAEAKAVAVAKAETAEKAAASDEALNAAQQLIAEQRKAAEALLREVSVLEERLKTEAGAAVAAREFETAQKKAADAALLEQQAKELAKAANENHTAATAERTDAETHANTARGEVEAGKVRVADLERRLTDAKQQVDRLTATAEQHEARAKEASEKESSAERESAEAAQRVIACQVARVAGDKELAGAKERAEALKKQLPTGTQDFAGIGEVQALAARFAEQASALTNQANKP